MTEPAPVPPGGPAPSREQLEGLTKDQIEETYGVPQNQPKADMVEAVLSNFGVPTPKSGEVVLAVDGLSSNAHRWSTDENDPLITESGTPVPASKAEQIIAQAAKSGITIREVN